MQGFRNFSAAQPDSGAYLSSFLAGKGNTDINPAMSGYSGFASSGGFSPGDIAAIRARSIAPIRGVYDAAKRNVNRAQALNPNLSNTAAAQAKLAREQSYATSDATTNAEGMIAQLLQQGKLAGLSGMSSTGLGARGQDLSAILGAGGQQLNALQGMTGLYGTTPGLANMFGQQVLGSAGQQIQSQQLRDALMNSAIQGRLGEAGTPSTFQNILKNTGSIFDIIGTGAGAFSGFGRKK